MRVKNLYTKPDMKLNKDTRILLNGISMIQSAIHEILMDTKGLFVEYDLRIRTYRIFSDKYKTYTEGQVIMDIISSMINTMIISNSYSTTRIYSNSILLNHD